MNPALVAPIGGMVGSVAMGHSHSIKVAIIKIPYQGYVGTVKDTNGTIALELRTGNEVIMIDKEKLYR